MTPRNQLADLIEELRALGDRDLRLTLRSLSSSEQDEVLALLEPAEASRPDFATLVGISGWLSKRIEVAHQMKGDEFAGGMTSATREVLVDCYQQLPKAISAPRRGKQRRKPHLLDRRYWWSALGDGR